MHRMRRHSTRGTGAPALWLVSASVLLAFVWGGAVAHATDSSGVQYSDTPPTVTGDNPPKRSAGGTEPPARSSRAGDGTAAPRTGSEPSQASKDKSSADDGSSRDDKPAGDGDGDNRQGSQDAGSTGKPGSTQGEDQSLALPASGDDDGDGSSPLLPILIAVLVLAAISGGVVLYRARRAPSEAGEPTAPRPS